MSSSEACLVVSLVQDFGWTLHQKSGAQTCLETFAPPRFGFNLSIDNNDSGVFSTSAGKETNNIE